MYTLMKADVLAQLAGLQQEISQLHDNAQQNQSHFVLLERRFSRLQSFNDEPQLQDYRLQLEHDDAVVKQIAQLRQVANAALCDYEKHQVCALCSPSSKTDDYLTSFNQSLQQEIKLAGMQMGEKVLLVGSGALPTTALVLVTKLGATVFCYDHDPAAQQLARQLVQSLGLEKQVQFIDNLKELTDRPVDHIIVASLVADKQALLAQLVPYVTRSSKLVMRYGNGLKSIFNCPYCHEANCSHWRTASKPVTTGLYDLIILEPNHHA